MPVDMMDNFEDKVTHIPTGTPSKRIIFLKGKKWNGFVSFLAHYACDYYETKWSARG